MKRAGKLCYIGLFFFFSLVPSVGMFFDDGESQAENRTLAQLPALWEDNGPNLEYLTQLGEYFQEHFAFRDELVTANACLFDRVGGISSAASVIRGTEGWLYYRDSLEDYQGSDLLSDRALFDIAHTLAMMQNYAWEQGVDFLFAAAPNKNSLYGAHMPYYYQAKVSEESNFSRLIPWLEAEQVKYVNLHRIFSEEGEVLYHKRDSHWNNKGAALAASSMMEALGKDHKIYEEANGEWRRDFRGDLDQMLFPSLPTLEEEFYYQPMPEFLYLEEVESNFDPRIYTQSLAKGSLVMYRDSFGNTLLPFLAEAYGEAYFSRGIPYQMSDLADCGADTLIVERAERFLPDMAENPPVMEAPLVLFDGSERLVNPEDIGELTAENWGNYIRISGSLSASCLETDTRIFVQAGEMMYEAFPARLQNGEEGFVLYLENILPAGAQNGLQGNTEESAMKQEEEFTNLTKQLYVWIL